MDFYLNIIWEAVVFFPLAAALISLPFTIHHYRKFGSVTFLRVFLVYSFVLYLMCAYFLVILPLPDREEVAQMTTPAVQLIPFSFFRDLPKETGFRLLEPATYLPALTSNFTLQFVFNIALLFPFGFYLRYYFRRKPLNALLLCFCFSLFFELTQLSGLYGIYPRPYRLFDVDDLLCNTLGGFLGYLLTGPLLRILPDREKIDEKSFEKGERVTFTRRALSFFVDLFFVSILSGLLQIFLPFANSYSQLLFPAAYLLYFGVLQWLWKGKSLGKRLTKLCVVNKDGTRVVLWRILLRYAFVCAEILLLSWGMLQLSVQSALSSPENRLIYLFLRVGILLILLFLFLLETVLNRSSRVGRDYPHGRISGTRLMSTVLRQVQDPEGEQGPSGSSEELSDVVPGA